MTRKFVVSESYDDEKYSKDCETHELNWFTAESVDCGDRYPVSWNSTSANENEVTDGGFVKDLIHVVATRPTNGRKDDGVVETESVIGDIKEKP